MTHLLGQADSLKSVVASPCAPNWAQADGVKLKLGFASSGEGSRPDRVRVPPDMPESRRDVLDRIYAGWGQGDFGAGSEDLAPDVQLVVDRKIPDGGVFLGPDGVRSYMLRFLGAWQSLTITARGFEETADAVLVEVDQTGIGYGSGAPVAMRYFQVWTFRGLEVSRMESILDEQSARRAAGLT